jgi:hypothetical protein
MNEGFTKLFSSIINSTIWREDDKTRIVWITMLAMADSKGNIWAAIPGLADAAKVSIGDCERAVEKFKGPDKYSRTKEHDGRRIIEIDGGFNILNYAKYREKYRNKDRRDYFRTKKQEERAKKCPPSKLLTSGGHVKCPHNVHTFPPIAEAEVHSTVASALIANHSGDESAAGAVQPARGAAPEPLAAGTSNPQEKIFKPLANMTTQELLKHKDNPLVMARLKKENFEKYKEVIGQQCPE